MVDAGWIRRRRCGARERHIDVLEVRAEIGVFRIELRRAYVVAVRGAGRPGQHSATRRVIREDTETPLTTTNCKHQKRHQKRNQKRNHKLRRQRKCRRQRNQRQNEFRCRRLIRVLP